MSTAIVGCNVGSRVGKTSQPDRDRFRFINHLRSVCRQCRVPRTEEAPGEIESLQVQART